VGYLPRTTCRHLLQHVARVSCHVATRVLSVTGLRSVDRYPVHGRSICFRSECNAEGECNIQPWSIVIK